jgi:heterotetrameric sarcosine oxidase gamma subunit
MPEVGRVGAQAGTSARLPSGGASPTQDDAVSIWRLSTDRLSIERLPPTPVLHLQIRRPSVETAARLGDLIGEQAPVTPNNAAGPMNRRISCVAPGEWMLVGQFALDALAAAAAGSPFHVAGIGDGRAVFEIKGEHARGLIAQGCSIDLHEREFPNGRCARTLFASVGALIDRLPGPHAFRVIVDVSYAHHVECWLEDALLALEE